MIVRGKIFAVHTATTLSAAMLGMLLSVPTFSHMAPLDLNGPALDEQRTMAEELALGGPKPINAEDNRLDFDRIKDPLVERVAKASVALFFSSELSRISDGRLQSKGTRFGARFLMCKDESFTEQITAAFCSGTLVADDVVLTAAHCVREASTRPGDPALSDVRFVFGFRAKNYDDPGRSQFGLEEVYSGVEVIAARRDISDRDAEDWATIRLDRPVPATVANPIMSRRIKVAKGMHVYAVGYPIGLPVKYAAGAQIRNDDSGASFKADLDTFQGNSGSGVFLSETNELLGILVRGDPDFYMDQKARPPCRRTYRCGTVGCTGEVVTRIEKVRMQ